MFKIFQADAFTSKIFGGNPAAVVPLEEWLDDAVLQSIAAENNLAETAYLVPVSSGWELRWFTPTAEVALCGHATLAAAHVLVTQLGCTDKVLNFETRESGTLTVECKKNGSFALSFPSIPVLESNEVPKIGAALGRKPDCVMYGHYSPDQIDFVAVYETEDIVSALRPNFSNFKELNSRGIIATARGDSCDFVSRYFGPNFGIDEDPVTGSAHCLLTPYWSDIFGKLEMEARQISPRGGEIHCTLDNDRVVLTGSAVNYLAGTIYI
ncbi:PhzF family phenazine biosynthesis protein [Granulosicoccus sp.]|nr:PhzF family phenazine biosynthesis protein [Granulosicoccus sp.]